MKMLTSPGLVMLVALLLTGCAATIDSTTLATRLAASDKRPVVVDVRTGSEYAGGHLPGAVNIPVQALSFQMAAVPVHERSEPVVVYCAHGPRAGLAGFFLRVAGFSEVMHLQGDIRSWREAGYPLTTGSEPGVYVK